MFNDGMSLSDIATVTRDNDSFGNSSWIIILFILFFAFGGNGFNGFGNGSNALTQAEMQAGFNNQNVIGKLDRLGDGISSLGYDLQGSLCNGFANTIATVNQTAYQTQNGLCEVNRNIDNVRYENAMNTATINANIDNKFAQLEKSQLEQTIACQQNQINQLSLQAQLAGVVRYPMASTYNMGCNPYCNSGCSC